MICQGSAFIVWEKTSHTHFEYTQRAISMSPQNKNQEFLQVKRKGRKIFMSYFEVGLEKFQLYDYRMTIVK